MSDKGDKILRCAINILIEIIVIETLILGVLFIGRAIINMI